MYYEFLVKWLFSLLHQSALSYIEEVAAHTRVDVEEFSRTVKKKIINILKRGFSRVTIFAPSSEHAFHTSRQWPLIQDLM